MSRVADKIALRALIAAIFLGFSSLVPAALARDDTTDRARELRRELSGDKRERKETQRQINELSERIAQAQQRLTELDGEIADNERALADSHLRHRVARSRLDAQLEKLKPLLRQSHRLGRGAEIRMWLQLDHISELAKMRHFHRLVKSRHQRRIVKYRQTLGSYTETLNQRRRIDASLRERQVEMATARRALERTLAESEAQFKLLGQRIEANEEELRRVLRRIGSSALAQQTQRHSFVARKGAMSWPVAGKLQNTFGHKRARGRLPPWKGVRIKARAGDNVRAIHGGRVVYAGWLGAMGLLMIIDHGDNFLSLYANGQSLLRDKGDEVSAGDPIAIVGKSGNFAEGELYFELRHKEKAVAPGDWIGP